MGAFEIFSSRIKELRDKKGMTQVIFSEFIGVTQQTLSGYENGRTMPSLDAVREIANKCHISIDWLCGLSDKESIEIKINTYSDILSYIMKLGDIEILKMVPSTNIKDESIYRDQSSSSLTFYDINLIVFLRDWESIKKLHDNKTIDDRLYKLWIDDKLEEYDRPIDGIPF